MRGRFVESGELCAEFPYRAKALFAFEEVDGTDICFFGMHVQVCYLDINNIPLRTFGMIYPESSATC